MIPPHFHSAADKSTAIYLRCTRYFTFALYFSW
jgi:hypothetical protein